MSPKTRFSALKSSDPASSAAAELSDRIKQMEEQAIERDHEATIQGQSLATLIKLIEGFMSPSRTIIDEPFSLAPPQPQTAGTKASEIVVESFITTPVSTKYHRSLLTSYRLKDLDPQALNKLPNGSLIKSTGDIMAHLRKEEETVITQFPSCPDSSGTKLLQNLMINAFINICENSAIPMAISTIVHTLIRALIKDPDSSWSVKSTSS